MKKTVEKWQSFMFVGSLSLIAIFIHSCMSQVRQQVVESTPRTTQSDHRNGQPSRPRAEAPGNRKMGGELTETERVTKPVEDSAALHRAFLARYVRPNLAPKLGVKTIGVVSANHGRTLNPAWATAIAAHLRQKKGSVVTGIFTPEFVSDGMFESAFGGTHNILERLELGAVIDHLVLAKYSVQFSKNPSLQDVLTASAQLEVVAWSIDGTSANHRWTFTANGAGFKEPEALAMAHERLTREINTETNMLFTLIESMAP